jgi:hypothetical protein
MPQGEVASEVCVCVCVCVWGGGVGVLISAIGFGNEEFKLPSFVWWCGSLPVSPSESQQGEGCSLWPKSAGTVHFSFDQQSQV